MAFNKETSNDLDDVKLAAHHEDIADIVGLSEEEQVVAKKLVRRIDLLIMPLVILVYLMNYIDRNNYAAARLQGLETDLNLQGNQYQTGLAILFVSYLLTQVPSNLFLNYCGRPSLYLGFFVTAWGLVSVLTSQVKGYGGIVACRFILGLVEAPFFSGALFYLSKWYTQDELTLRMAIFYSGSLISGAFGNLIAAGILNGLAGKRGLAAWQWLYIIEGSITVFIGLIICAILPDFPHTWRLLSEQEKHVANRRMALEAANADTDDGKGMSQLRGLKLAVMDIKTWILAIGYMAMAGAGGFQNFFPTLTDTLGYDHIVSLLLVAPPYVFMTFWTYAHGVIADRCKRPFWFYMYPVPITIIGSIIFMNCTTFGPRYFSFFLVIFIFAMNSTIYSWIASSIPLGNSASIWTPYTFTENQAPYYRTAFGISLALQILAALMGVTLRWVLEVENRRLEKLENEDAPLSEADMESLRRTAEIGGIDIAMARAQQRGFRYMI
ncbi:hypothetical protein ASPWEDRAFT_53496 [Aspergillus wentii DTO 134E9]|uniref:Major facilitator superfamily (MFS) profile domain-containing protein n=1 Tax=Aspergillus wentii DTO 134E9 TaxID=1073089 RepID=A0A1L9RF81_ASPWE|nr:uncharacterized protein ASPWEDRAFT_53496 [Aspergillus wentii DTO 134E9]KAI9926247.1 hypothetical protein MW887_004710 [Aspergillus wentii]OJJ33576.1 hypothetical protein ASPWEDRAFT_53496 [Aspergillus wentii DTO 134E9]